jgi:hypothetical protein
MSILTQVDFISIMVLELQCATSTMVRWCRENNTTKVSTAMKKRGQHESYILPPTTNWASEWPECRSRLILA